MEHITSELDRLGVSGARELKSVAPETYSYIKEFCKRYGYKTVGGVIRTYHRLGFLTTGKHTCPVCGGDVDTTKGSITCSKTCGNKYVWNDPELSSKRLNSIKEMHKKRVETGVSTEIAKKAFQTRKNRGTLQDELIKASVSRKETYKKKHQQQYEALVEKGRLNKIRIDRILKKKNLYFVCRMIFLHSRYSILPLETWNRVVLECSRKYDINLSFLVNNNAERRFVHKGKHNAKPCIHCGTLTFNRRYCSLQCANVCPVRIESVQRKLEVHRADPVYSQQISESLKLRWSSVPQDERQEWAQKVLNALEGYGIIDRRNKALETKLATGKISAIRIFGVTPERKDYLDYKKEVGKLTRDIVKTKFDLELIGKHTNHVDHIFPVSKGYFYKIPAELIGHPNNLQLLPAPENRIKSNTITEIPKQIQEYIVENGIEIIN